MHDAETLPMPLPRVWLTVERLLIALVPVIAGTLIETARCSWHRRR